MNVKHLIIISLYLLVLFLLYTILTKQPESFKTISYDDNILLRSTNINLNSLQTNKVNIKDLTFSNGRLLTKDTIKSLKEIPLKLKDKICLGDTCIDIPHINKVKQFFPYGSIIAYYNDNNNDNIPNGWDLCDGSNNTPDLRGKFIIGAGRNYNIKDTGGQDTITLEAKNIPEHSHDMFIPKKGTDIKSEGSIHKFLDDSIINEGIKGGNGFFIGPSNFSSPVDKESTLEYIENVKIYRHKGGKRWGNTNLTFNYEDKFGNKGVWNRHIKKMFRYQPRIIPINLIVKKGTFKYSNLQPNSNNIYYLESNLILFIPPAKEVPADNTEHTPTQYNTLPAHFKVVYLMRNVKPEKPASKTVESKDCHITIEPGKTKEEKKEILIAQLKCLGQTPWI